jgi:3-deoxy-D-manno-octulosonic acid kinase
MADKRKMHNDAGGPFNLGDIGSMQRVETFIDGQHILYDAAAITNITPDWFEPAHWRERDALTGEAAGRGTSYFFRAGGGDYVLRHYHRGGMAAALLRDRYLRWFSLKHTRAWREWDILSRLWREGLPVPRPVAARVIFSGLFYRADIITAKLPVPSTLVELLKTRTLSAAEWQAAGRLIRRFHEAGVYHADMNAHNIVYAANRLYLLDFDRGRLCPRKSAWQQRTLRRLHRSLLKSARQNPGFHFSGADWETLLQAYHSANEF